MLEKIIKMHSLSVLSRILLKQESITALRCYSKTIATTRSKFLSPLTKPIIFKSTPCPSTLQLTKVINYNLIQKRFQNTHGDHVNLWKLERIVSTAFIPLIPLCFIFESPVLDSILAVLSVLHAHWGFEAIIIDYVRPKVVGQHITKICFISLYFLSAFTLAGLTVLIYNGPGISKVIKNGWAIGKDKCAV